MANEAFPAQTPPIAPQRRFRTSGPVGPLYGLSLFLFVFPLLTPAIGGTVVYPFALYGLYLFLRQPLKRGSLFALGTGLPLFALYAFVDFAASMRIVAFVFGCVFLIFTLRDERRIRLLLRMGGVHAAVVIVQFMVVIAGWQLDFSEVLRAVYGSLLPSTGIHIDYNAFSQLEIFLPRVAGLNREPAYASVLFLGLTYIAVQRYRWKLVAILTIALLCTLSKIVFPLLLAFAVASIRQRRTNSRRPRAVIGRLVVFVAANMAVVGVVNANIELVEGAMLLDASYYHRFIDLHTLSEDLGGFAAFGNSQARIGSAAIFYSYEFIDDKRAFLDGSALSKVFVDLGYVAAGLYAFLVALVSANWLAALALAVAGLFINLLSVSPATITLFVLLSGLATTTHGKVRQAEARRPRGPGQLRYA